MLVVNFGANLGIPKFAPEARSARLNFGPDTTPPKSMKSDFFTQVMGASDARSATRGASITGLDLLFPDAGFESSTEPLEERIEKIARIIRRWWRILDGKSVDTWDEVGYRRRGVRREMGYQYLAMLIDEEESLADRSITAEELALHEQNLRALEKANRLYLLGTHRFKVEEGYFLESVLEVAP